MAIVSGGVSTQVLAIGLLETPVTTISGVPANAEVGDAITPAINVLREDGITPVDGMKIDFLVSDAYGTYTLGARQDTDASGDATSPSTYYVGEPDAGGNITYIFVLRPKIV